jgi:hypothetical protein
MARTSDTVSSADGHWSFDPDYSPAVGGLSPTMVELLGSGSTQPSVNRPRWVASVVGTIDASGAQRKALRRDGVGDQAIRLNEGGRLRKCTRRRRR